MLAFIYFPLVVIGLYAFNDDITQSWPIENWTTKWFSVALPRRGRPRRVPALGQGGLARDGRSRSCSGPALSFAIARYRFFGRNTLSFLVVLPIALPGIVTGIALNATIDDGAASRSGSASASSRSSIGHATFCIVVVYNNVIARLRRTSLSFEEASSDLGADTCTDVPAA